MDGHDEINGVFIQLCECALKLVAICNFVFQLDAPFLY